MIITIKKKDGNKYIPEDCRASTLFRTLGYDEDSFLFQCDDNSIGYGFLCQPLAGADEKVQERVNGFLGQEYPKKTIVQFMSFRSPDISKEIYEILNIRDGFRNELLTSTINERVTFLQHHTRNRMVSHTEAGIYDNGIIHDQKRRCCTNAGRS